MPVSKNLHFIIAILLVVLSACQQGSSIKTEKVEANKNSQHSLNFIVHPYDNPSRLVARFTPLCDYLGLILGQPVNLVIARSYVDRIQRISKGQADIAYMGPTPFLRAQDHYLVDSQEKLIPIAAEEKDGKASYRSVIIVRDDSDIQTVKDLVNRTLALGAPHSFSSHYVPRVLIGNAGLAFKDLRDFAFLGRHERVALAVLHGDFDAGGLNREVALLYQNASPGLRILSTSPPLPPHLIIARSGMEKKVLQQLSSALLEPDNEDESFRLAVQSLGAGTRFTNADMKFFERARRIIATVESIPSELLTW